MAKVIKITPQYIAGIREDFEKALINVKLSDGKFNFQKSFGDVGRKATLYFTECAWIKMNMLIEKFDKEVGWHGLAYRGDNPEKDEYTIKDILVYPQDISDVTVTTDQKEYQSWLMEQDDEVFNNIRMQGHSHVNMSTFPSGVDTTLYERILEQLEDGMFYIFLIFNKRGEKYIKIYDMLKNVMFETVDITVVILDGENGFNKFISDAKEKVRDKVYYQTLPVKSTTAPVTPATVPTVPSKTVENAQYPKPFVKPTSTQTKKEGALKKGANWPFSSQSTYGGYASSFEEEHIRGSEGDDADDDPYSPFGYAGDRYFRKGQYY